APHVTHRDPRGRLRARLHLRRDRAAAAAVAAGGLSRGGRDRRAVHPRLRGRSDAGAAAGRDRRDPADVRRRPALLDPRPARGQEHRGAGRAGGDDGCYHDRLAGGQVPARVFRWRQLRVRPVTVGGQHRGADARSRRAAPARLADRPYRDGLADRRGLGHGARAGAVAAAGGRAARRYGGIGGCMAGAAHHAAEGRRIPRLHDADRPACDSLGARTRRRHRFARAVHAVRARDRARRRVRFGDAVRRVVRARRVLRRHDPQRIRVQPSGRERNAAAARCVRGAVLRLGRHAVRPGDPAGTAVAGAGDVRGDPRRQGERGMADRARIRPPDNDGAHDRCEPRADRRVLFHPRRPRPAAAHPAARRPAPDPRRRAAVDHRQSAAVRVAGPATRLRGRGAAAAGRSPLAAGAGRSAWPRDHGGLRPRGQRAGAFADRPRRIGRGGGQRSAPCRTCPRRRPACGARQCGQHSGTGRGAARTRAHGNGGDSECAGSGRGHRRAALAQPGVEHCRARTLRRRGETPAGARRRRGGHGRARARAQPRGNGHGDADLPRRAPTATGGGCVL
ncbi:MAG: Inner membrane protein YbaL, KefB/KefC family, partial [uncultured Lysobacter sp.]